MKKRKNYDMAQCKYLKHGFVIGIKPNGKKEIQIVSPKTERIDVFENNYFIKYVNHGKEYEKHWYKQKTRKRAELEGLPFNYLETYTEYFEIPCGKCEICKAEQARQKAERAMLEKTQWKESCVINLTYNDENMPKNSKGIGTLKKEDYQKFNKKFRKYYKNHYGKENLRFMIAGEYGEKYERPHYHMICFNWDIQDKEFKGYTKKGSREYESKEISKLWGKGYVTIGECDEATIQYVANYVVKKIKGDKGKYYKDNDLIPEFVQCSTGTYGGLGKIKLLENLEQYKESGKIYAGIRAVGTNRYFDDILRKTEQDGEKLVEMLKEKRKKKMEQREETRAYTSGVDIETQRENERQAFYEKLKKIKQRNGI